ncbi:NAD(P)-dependent oxidoreductase [Frigidibacter mobilis]|uniref:Oxidoreductase n=1 Tax=Frigidibacter mobilis TaxID=1335048 RepID=A0A159Z0F2_9RHOB|nr:NAD(P)-dependent oxidoreductase [Frigidibacter mobilis]AMY67344.1 oxidoreductase [Frigidibacter mobilis]
MMDGTARIALIGFGEAAMAFVSGWASVRTDPLHAPDLRAYDIKTEDPAQAGPMQARYAQLGVSGCTAMAGALAGAKAAFCLVTADRALEAATTAAGSIVPGTLWLDCNSCAPQTKQAAAAVIGAAGGRYVDVAVMAPVHPKRHLVPLLVAGPDADAEAGATLLRSLGMRPEIAGQEIGQASAIKMLRSVMIKGMEALTAECLLAARKVGVEAQVIASLQASDPGTDWQARGAYNMERMMVHGARRAAEMREVVATVAALGLPNAMSDATARWQDRVAATGAEAGAGDLAGRLDRILARL